MSEVEPPKSLHTSRGEGPIITLQRGSAPNPGSAALPKPVLLLHGASANSRTFQVPYSEDAGDGQRKRGGLAAFLADRGFDPWLLDWRASSLIFEEETNRNLLKDNAEEFNFSSAAKRDVPWAVQKILDLTGARQVSVVGHCMGAGVLAEAIAQGYIEDGTVDRVVLMTLGLFYETPLDGRLKVQDRVIERLAGRSVRSVDPRVDDPRFEDKWDDELESMYASWPGALKSHETPDRGGPDRVENMCNRLGFIYGVPYLHENLVREIHADKADGEESLRLEDLFGGIALQMLVHGARNIRHRRAIDFSTGAEVVSDAALAHFRKLEKVTLITGALNRLWHRDSIDLMHEWLSRGSVLQRNKVRKCVFPSYAHQDLLWGNNSATEVFPTILDGLSR